MHKGCFTKNLYYNGFESDECACIILGVSLFFSKKKTQPYISLKGVNSEIL